MCLQESKIIRSKESEEKLEDRKDSVDADNGNDGDDDDGKHTHTHWLCHC